MTSRAANRAPRYPTEHGGRNGWLRTRSSCKLTSVRRLLGLALAALLLAGWGARALSVRLLYPVSEIARLPTPDGFGRIETRAADGVRVRALRLDGPAGAPVVVVFHNNRETAEQGASLARALQSRGLGTVLAEYRGYGASGAVAPDEGGLYADADAVLDWLAAHGVGPERVVLLGRSLGSGVAAEMALRGRGRALVLVSPYTSIDRLVTDVAPFLPARLLVRDRFDTLTKARSIRVPTLIVHGDADEIVPFAMGETLAQSLPRAHLLRVPRANHADVVAAAGAGLVERIFEIATARASSLPGP